MKLNKQQNIIVRKMLEEYTPMKQFFLVRMENISILEINILPLGFDIYFNASGINNFCYGNIKTMLTTVLSPQNYPGQGPCFFNIEWVQFSFGELQYTIDGYVQMLLSLAEYDLGELGRIL